MLLTGNLRCLALVSPKWFRSSPRGMAEKLVEADFCKFKELIVSKYGWSGNLCQALYLFESGEARRVGN